jgi:hypothetical protein
VPVRCRERALSNAEAASVTIVPAGLVLSPLLPAVVPERPRRTTTSMPTTAAAAIPPMTSGVVLRRSAALGGGG